MLHVKTFFCLFLSISTLLPLYSLDLIPGDRSFTVRTKRIEATFKNGMIENLVDLSDGTVLANKEINDTLAPSGLGILSDMENFRATHILWGEPALGQHLNLDFPLPNYWHPCEQSIYKADKLDSNTIVASWTGLSNQREFLPTAKLTIKTSSDPHDALTIQVSGFSPRSSLFGAQCPLVNINNGAKIITPSFGGIIYTKDGPPALMPFAGSPFLEAPLLIAQVKKKSIAVWLEDEKFGPHYAFVRRSEKSFSISLETLNLMPFESNKNFISPIIKLDIFNGDWKSAATPFRAWYAKYFSEEIKMRDRLEWANRITNIIDIYMNVPPNKVLDKIAKLFAKDAVMFQIWNARRSAFDSELPDWTPRDEYIDGIKRIHKSGFKAMAYVNTYCANYQSPVWNRDNLSEFFLTRKNSCWKYKTSSEKVSDKILSEKLIGTVDASPSVKYPFANISEGRLLYGDPLSERWRTYHANMMKWWNTITATDANYEDTAGCTGDFGNGVVGGLSAAQGSVEQMRLLLKMQPHVPMAAEYGPSGIAFAVKWPLNLVSAWGNDKYKLYRMNHQIPLTSYIYGYRNWISAQQGDSDMIMHAMSAASDALGGMGFILVDYFILNSLDDLHDVDYSFSGHLFLRAKIFANKGLKPYFPVENYPSNIICLYEGNDGIYKYYDDGNLQQMIGPSNEILYGRVHGKTEIQTSLFINNWPFQDGKHIFGLDPDAHYPLFPQPEVKPQMALNNDDWPTNAFVKKYYEDNDYAFMEIHTLPETTKNLKMTLRFNRDFKFLSINDSLHEISGNTFTIQDLSPLRVVAFAKIPSAFPKSNTARIVSSSRVQGKTTKLEKHPHIVRNGHTLFLNNGKEGYADFFFHVPDALDSSVDLYLLNMASSARHGCDGTNVKILINGKLIKELDCRSINPEYKNNPNASQYLFDTDLHYWNIPLGSYAGKPILFSIVTDAKKNPIGDKQFISVPVLSQNEEQIFKEEIIHEDK